MTSVFLDTAGLLANWDSSAELHAVARNAYEEMLAQRRPIVTSTFVMLECGNSASRRPYRSAVARFRAEMETAGLLIARATVREGQLTATQMADLSRMFVGSEALNDWYGGAPDGPEIVIVYGNKRVHSGGGPDTPRQIDNVHQRIDELAESMPTTRS